MRYGRPATADALTETEKQTEKKGGGGNVAEARREKDREEMEKV